MKKVLALLLALLTVGASLVSCGNDTTEPADTTAAETTAENAADETTDEMTNEQKLSSYVESLPDNDYEGYEFVIMTRSDVNPYWFTRDVFSEGEDGEPINDAVYQRNRLMEEQFNIVVKDNPSSANPSNEAKTLINSGEDTFAFVTDGVSLLSNMAVAGMAIDYKDVDTIDLENEWWDQRMNSDLSIGNHLYTVTGDISIMDNEGTWQLLFNKGIHENYNLDDYYAMRDDGTWTLEVLIADAEAVVSDVNGDGVMNVDDGDSFGLATEEFNTYALWAAAGMTTTAKNADDLPEYTLYNEKSANIVERIMDIQLNENVVFNHNTSKQGFRSGLSLFMIVGMRVLPDYRQDEIEFGILPLPKYTETQDRYYSFGSHSNLTAYLMPITTSDVDRSGTLIEAMAGISMYTLTPAYYETSLMGKYIRDDESAHSIDIILANRSYDLGVIFGFGNPTPVNIFQNMTKEKARDFASRCAAQEPSMIAAIEEFVESLE